MHKMNSIEIVIQKITLYITLASHMIKYDLTEMDTLNSVFNSRGLQGDD